MWYVGTLYAQSLGSTKHKLGNTVPDGVAGLGPSHSRWGQQVPESPGTSVFWVVD